MTLWGRPKNFIAGLHRDVQEQFEDYAVQESGADSACRAKTTPLVPPIPEDEDVDQITSPADPFIESLTKLQWIISY